MAILEKPAMGMVSGKVGDVVFRIVGDYIVITTYPDHIKISDSPESVTNRKNFGVLTRLVKAVNTVGIFRQLWKKYPGKSISTKLIAANKNKLGENDNISNIVMVPAESYVPVQLSAFNISGNKISVTIEGLEKITFLSDYQYVSAQGVIEVIDTDTNKTDFIGIASKDELNNNGEPVTLEFLLDKPGKLLLESSPDNKFLINVIYKNTKLEPTYVSENIFIYPQK